MNARLSLGTLVRTYGLWAAVLSIPLIVNSLFWSWLVVPQRGQVRVWHDAKIVAALKPKLDAVLTESEQILTDAERTGFASQDPAAVMEAIRRLAGAHRVDVKEIRMERQEGKASGVAGYSAMPVQLQVSGRFSKLAHWMSAVESQAGLQVEQWSIAPGKAPSEPLQLSVTLTALLRET
jgi:type II secretory pathway component PulM